MEIRGNTQTRDFVILRELPLAAGELYDQRKVEKIAPRLTKLGYFKWINPPRLQWQKNETGKLIIELAEGSYNRFDGVIGYNPGTQESKGFVTGLIDVSFGNLFGTGRQVDAHWERRTEKTQQLRLHYLEPWVAGLPLNAGLGFEQVIQDTSYVERALALDLRLRVNESLGLFSRVATRSVTPDSLAALRFGIPPSNSVSLALGVAFDSRDNVVNPRSGVNYRASFEWSRKKVSVRDSLTAVSSESESFNQKRISVDLETYLPVLRWQVFAVGVHGREIRTDEEVVSVTDQYRFGGTRTLRGYREEQFRGSKIAWANIEYRYLVNDLSRLFLFLDLGYFFREDLVQQVPVAVEAAKIGYGFGMRVDTRLGLLGVDYGLGEGDSFSRGKIHISLRNAF